MERPVRLAVFVSEYPAPSHTFIRREIDALRRRGVDVVTYSVRKPVKENVLSERDQRDVGETFYLLPPSLTRMLRANAKAFTRRPLRYLRTFKDALTHRVPGGRGGLWALFYFQEAMILAAELEEQEVTHLHNHFANAAAIVGYLTSRYLDLGWSVTLHGISCFDYPSGLLLAEKIEHARFIACVTHFGRAQAYRTCDPQHWSKLFVSRCGVDLSRLPEKKPNGRARKRFLTVGRVSPEKGHVGLIEAFAGAVSRGLDAELRLVGDGPDLEIVKRAIEAHRIGDRVSMPGRVAEERVLEEMADADFFVMTSFMEGLPVVLMEALALELPVIAPCVAGIPELVVHRETGLLFAPSHWEELTERMLELAADPELASRMARAGRARVEKEFDVDRAVEPLFSRLMGSP
jgi:glycosyltransferase involved in cell wall biosynthesis